MTKIIIESIGSLFWCLVGVLIGFKIFGRRKTKDGGPTPGEALEIIAEQATRIYYLEKKTKDLQDTEARRQEWLDKAKKEAGFNRQESFDNVWKVCLNSYLQATQAKKKVPGNPGDGIR